MQVILTKLKIRGTIAEYIILKKNHVNVDEWRFLLSVFANKSVQRVQNYKINALSSRNVTRLRNGDVSACFFLNHVTMLLMCEKIRQYL